MPELNFIAIAVAALVPNILGALYYGPILGNKWLASLNFSKTDLEGRNEALIYGTALALSFVVSFFIKFIVASLHKDIDGNGELVFASFKTFSHGALHGIGLAIGLVVPVVICLGLFQKSKRSNILINSIFWILCFAIMGGILDVWN